MCDSLADLKAGKQTHQKSTCLIRQLLYKALQQTDDHLQMTADQSNLSLNKRQKNIPQLLGTQEMDILSVL